MIPRNVTNQTSEQQLPIKFPAVAENVLNGHVNTNNLNSTEEIRDENLISDGECDHRTNNNYLSEDGTKHNEQVESFNQKEIEMATKNFAETIKNETKLYIKNIEKILSEKITAFKLPESDVLEEYIRIMTVTIQEMENQMKNLLKDETNDDKTAKSLRDKIPITNEECDHQIINTNLPARESEQLEKVESFSQNEIEMAARSFARTIKNEAKFHIENVEQIVSEKISALKLSGLKDLEKYNQIVVATVQEMENQMKMLPKTEINVIKNSHYSTCAKDKSDETVTTNGGRDRDGKTFDSLLTEQVQNMEDIESFYEKGIEMAARKFAKAIKNEANQHIENIEQLFFDEIATYKLPASKVLEEYSQMVEETIQEMENQLKKLIYFKNKKLQQSYEFNLKGVENVLKTSKCDHELEISREIISKMFSKIGFCYLVLQISIITIMCFIFRYV